MYPRSSAEVSLVSIFQFLVKHAVTEAQDYSILGVKCAVGMWFGFSWL
jgi:hypothetical protein